MKLGRLLHVTFKWLPQPPHECGTATYLTSGVSRDVYEIHDKVCKFTSMDKAKHTNIPEMGSASDLRELVPACYGHFTVYLVAESGKYTYGSVPIVIIVEILY